VGLTINFFQTLFGEQRLSYVDLNIISDISYIV